MSVQDLVTNVGTKLGRSEEDVQPYLTALEDNWYDTPEAVAAASADDLAALGLPRRFAVELIAAAGPGEAEGRAKGKGRTKGRDEEREEWGKGKSRGKGDDYGKGKGKGKAKGDVVRKIPVDLEGVDPGLRPRGKLVGIRGANVFHIQDHTGTRVEVNGQEAEGWLEFVISASDHESADKAVEMCEDLIANVFEELGISRRQSKGKSNGKGKGKTRGEASRTISVDLEGVDPGLRPRAKLVGMRGANIFHIQDHTGARVELNGVEAEGWLEFVITAGDAETVDKAAEMCQDLTENILEELGVSRRGGKGKYRSDAGKGKHKGEGKGKHKSEGKGKGKKRFPRREQEIRIPIETAGVDPEFGLRFHLIGEGGKNVKHIEQATSCNVSVEHDDGEGMAFTIGADDDESLDLCKSMCEDLLATVMEEAGAGSGKRSFSSGGKGKGKRKGKEEDRPYKYRRTDGW